MDLLSTCSGPQASSIFCAVSVSEYEHEPMKREADGEKTQSRRRGRRRMEKAQKDGGYEEIDQSF